MRKQKLRQLLAVLLTLCLLLGCVPAVFAADQTKELELQQTPVSISPEMRMWKRTQRTSPRRRKRCV